MRQTLDALVVRRGRRGRHRVAGVVCATTGLGLCAEGIAMAVAPRHPALGQALFFVAIVVPFAIYLAILVLPQLGDLLRQVTVAVLGLYPAVVYRMSSPLVLAGYDEHQHAQSLMNLLLGAGLFSPNPVMPVSPYYPGLEIFTGAGIRLTGLPTVLVISVVVLLCRLLLVLTIYHCALLVSRSRRGASLMVAFYAVSPHFYSFDSGFAYETLALTLGLGGIYLLRRAQLADRAAARPLFVGASLALVATVVTHHITGWLVLAFIIGWAAVSRKGERTLLVRATGIMGVAAVAWTAAFSSILWQYLEPIAASITQAVQAFLAGKSQHHIFGASVGTPAVADWERVVLVIFTVSTTIAALICAWIMLRQAFRNRDRMLGLLGALNLAFPLTAAAHIDPSVGEVGDRAATFLFLPLALSCSLIVQRHPRVTRRPAGTRHPFRPAVLAALIGATAVLYLGGTLLGSSPDWNRLPGPYLVSADFRSQDPETLAAVDWAATHLPNGYTVVADRVPAVLLGSRARLWPLTHTIHGLMPSQLYFSRVWGFQQTKIVKRLPIDYVYVDTRLADSLPYLGYYIAQGETKKPTRLTEADVAKFAHVPGLTPIYHHGPVTIYDTAGLGVHPLWGGFRGHQAMGLGPLDAIVGGAVALLVLRFRRRLAWVASAIRDTGVLATTLAVMATTIFVGGLLFAARLMPGPAFTVGVLVTLAANSVVRTKVYEGRYLPRIRVPRRWDPRVLLEPLVLLGIVAGASGLAVAVHAAWITDVVKVNAILQTIR